MISPTKSIKAIYQICEKCGDPKKPVVVIRNGKRKQCFECKCGIYTKNGVKI